MRNVFLYSLAAPAIFFAALCLNSTAAVKRPKILGVSHMAIYEDDLAKARAFYEDFLGFAELGSVKRPGSSEDQVAFIKINDYQSLELFAEPPKQDGHLNHIAFYTDDAEAMREYLAGEGIKVPAKVGVGALGNANFTVIDPDDHAVEMVQYLPDGSTVRNKGKFMPDTRISDHMMHVGVTVAKLDESMKFYHGILGFTEFWRGTRNPSFLSWVNVRVPDGQDYLEMMLYRTYPGPAQIGSSNHICLMVPDMEKAVATLKTRPYFKTYGRELEIHTGVNRKRQVNIFDPDGTRVELMEPTTIDGQPAPSSDAPPPTGIRSKQ
jgi:lactoylglutathione lyase